MNVFTSNSSPATTPPVMPGGMQDDDDSINLLGLLDVVLDQRWLIAGVTALALLLGGAYALLAPPVYEANTIIQVEDSKANPMGGMLGDAGGMFDIRSPITAEMEILRSRLVVGQAVSNLQLDLNITPKYLPLIGRWLARNASEPSAPGLLSFNGYVRGNEALKVGTVDLPLELQNRRLSVVLQAGAYELRDETGLVLARGHGGEMLEFEYLGKPARLLVVEAIGNPGAEFYLQQSSTLPVTEGLQAALKISELGRQSSIIRASMEGTDPVRVTNILNEIGALYVRQNIERKAAEAEKSLGFLNIQLPQLRQQLEISENKYNQFRNRSGTFNLSEEAKLMFDQSIMLQTKLLDLEQKRQEVASRYKTQTPSLQGLDAQIANIKSEIAGIHAQTRSFPNVEQELLRLMRDVKVNNELYTSLLNSLQELRLIKEGKVGNVRIVDVAVVPERAIKPQRGMVLALSVVLGLLAGLGLAFLRNSMKSGVTDAADIEQHLGLHVFATVPHSRDQEALAQNLKQHQPGVQLLATHKPDDPGIESLRSLRTALQFAMLDAPNNILLISGPTPGIGKSFTSANFAAVLGASGKRVLLIDGDMRKGHIHLFFGLKRGHGLSELITASQTVEEVIHRDVVPQVDLITTGTLPPNPAELLSSPSTAHLLQTLSARYDIVLIDTPPILAVADTQVLAPQAGTVFLVARAEVTSLGEMHESAKRLSQAGIATKGVIFNDLNISKRRYGHAYGYKYSRYRYTNYQYGTDSGKK